MQLILTHNGTEIARGAAGSTISISGLTISPALDGWTYDHPDFVAEEIFEPDEEGEPVSLGWTERSPLDPPSGHYALVAVPEEPPVEFEPLTPEQARYLMPALSPPQFRLMLLEDLGIDETEMDSRIAAIPDQTIRNRTHIYWKHATEFRRTDPLLVTAVESLLSKTQAEADVIWMDFHGRFAGGV